MPRRSRGCPTAAGSLAKARGKRQGCCQRWPGLRVAAQQSRAREGLKERRDKLRGGKEKRRLLVCRARFLADERASGWLDRASTKGVHSQVREIQRVACPGAVARWGSTLYETRLPT